MSMQIDAILDEHNTEKNVDKVEFGITMDISDIGRIAFAHIKNEMDDDGLHPVSNHLALQSDLLGYSAHLGWRKAKNDTSSSYTTCNIVADDGDSCTPEDSRGEDTFNDMSVNLANSTLFAGVSGSLGDTGVNFAFQVRSERSRITREFGDWR